MVGYKTIKEYVVELKNGVDTIKPEEVKLPKDMISYTVKSISSMTGTKQKKVILCNQYPNDKSAFMAAFNTASKMLKETTPVNEVKITEFSGIDYKGNKVKLPELNLRIEKKRVELRPGERVEKDFCYD